MELNEGKFVGLANNSIDLLNRYLNESGEVSQEQIMKVHVATTMVGAFVRFKQSQGNLVAVKVSLITRLTDSKEELAEYIRVSVPELQLACKALASGKKL